MQINLFVASVLAVCVSAATLPSSSEKSAVEIFDFVDDNLAQWGQEEEDKYFTQTYNDEYLYDLSQTYDDAKAKADAGKEEAKGKADEKKAEAAGKADEEKAKAAGKADEKKAEA